MQISLGSLIVECVAGDITAQRGFDAVVNAANAQLVPGGGVAGAIHRAAGPALVEACRPFAPIRPGEAVLTPGFQLSNPFVIHCLGPVFGADGPAEELFRSCYLSILRLADEQDFASLATPAISTGVFGYPMADAAQVALETVFAQAGGLGHLRRIRFVLHGQEALGIHEAVLDRLSVGRR